MGILAANADEFLDPTASLCKKIDDWRFIMARNRVLEAAAAALILAGTTGGTRADEGAILGTDGKALLRIATRANAIPAERTAAEELRTYLGKITGADFAVVDESDAKADGPTIYLGQTAFAAAQGIDAAKLGEEESILRTVDGNLIITGGRPRGTLYAVYILLEDVLGCRWYTPWCEEIPARRDCRVPALNLCRVPAFAMRDIYARLPCRKWDDTLKKQWTLYCVRNRWNGLSPTRNTWWRHNRGQRELVPGGDIYGGGAYLYRGAPHTFATDFPADKYFEQHPTWYSERRGVRVPSNGRDGNHLCLTNTELRRAYLERLKERMRAAPDIHVFMVAMNDGGNRTACDCTKCADFAKESSWTDLYLDFLNELAAGIREEFPNNRLRTIAYSFAAKPPVRTRTADNIIIVACLLTSQRIRLEKVENGIAYSNPLLAEWAKACMHLEVWDYAEVRAHPFLAPIYFRTQEQLRFCKRLGAVTGVFEEDEIDFSLDMVQEFYAMRLWLYAKLLQDPDQDILALIRDFMEGYYGSAGTHLFEYIRLQRQRLHLWPIRMVDYAFAKTMHRLYDRAEAAVGDQPEYLERVKDARIWADIITLSAKTRLAEEFVRSGNRIDDFPFKSSAVRDRAIAQLQATRDPFWRARATSARHKPRFHYALAELTEKYVNRLALGNDYAPLPAQFRQLPPDRVVDIPGYQLARVQKAELIDDPDSVFGVASARMTAEEMPVAMGVYDPDAGTSAGFQVFRHAVPGKGYYTYRLPRTTVPVRGRFWFTKSWQISQELGQFHDPTNMTQEWDLYVSIKLDGPAYPHGDANARNGVYIDRLILVKTRADEQ